jgi:nucleotidyltransferase/DNA polymerase involved in DNA repair
LILHLDADAFFASCEKARDPGLKNVPLVVGQERGIATAVSYEAKALGVFRGMRTLDIRKSYPQVKIVPSDYEYYSFLSCRFFGIVKRFVPILERYSIDECFADLSKLAQGCFLSSKEDVASSIKDALESELGLSFSVGVAPTKVLAKIASSLRKPSGLVFISLQDAKCYLKNLPLVKVWGFGARTAALLSELGIRDSLEFAEKSESFVRAHLNKTGVEIWRELNGVSVYKVEESTPKPLSMQRFRTFYPPVSCLSVLFAKISYHIECLCARLHRLELVCSRAIVVLRNDNFQYLSFEVRLPFATSHPSEILKRVRPGFENFLWGRGRQSIGERYRTCGVVLTNLGEKSLLQLSFLSDAQNLYKKQAFFDALDTLRSNFGEERVFLASSKGCGEIGKKVSTGFYKKNSLRVLASI